MRRRQSKASHDVRSCDVKRRAASGPLDGSLDVQLHGAPLVHVDLDGDLRDRLLTVKKLGGNILTGVFNGSANFDFDKPLEADGQIGRMAVVKEWRRRGVGGALLEGLVNEARKRGLTEVRLWAPVQALEPGMVRLYLNLGRRDRLRPPDLQALVSERTGLAEPKLQVRNTHTYIAVRKEEADKVVSSLHGTKYGSRDLVCEPAKPKP